MSLPRQAPQEVALVAHPQARHLTSPFSRQRGSTAHAFYSIEPKARFAQRCAGEPAMFFTPSCLTVRELTVRGPALAGCQDWQFWVCSHLSRAAVSRRVVNTVPHLRQIAQTVTRVAIRRARRTLPVPQIIKQRTC